MASTSAGIVYSFGMMAVLMPYCSAASAVTGPIEATLRGIQEVGRLLGAEDLHEVLDRGRARERHHVDALLEQHAIDVRIAFALDLGEHRPVRDDFGHVRAALAQFLGQHFARDVRARKQKALAFDVALFAQRLHDRFGARFGRFEIDPQAVAGEAIGRCRADGHELARP